MGQLLIVAIVGFACGAWFGYVLGYGDGIRDAGEQARRVFVGLLERLRSEA